MIFFYIKYDTYGRIKWKETVCIFTGLHNPVFRTTNSYIAMENIQSCSYRNCRVKIGIYIYMCKKRCCCCLSMSSGNSNGILIILHYLSNHVRTYEHRNFFVDCLHIFRVVRRNCCCIYYKICIFCNVFWSLSIIYFYSKYYQILNLLHIDMRYVH